MSVLAKNEILKEVKKGNIKIEPFDKENIGPGSIDLTLGDKFRVFKKSEKIYDVHDEFHYHEITSLVTASEMVLQPQETILGITQEKITLAPNICGRLEGRSRFARIGLMVHISASFMQPGIDNHPVLEISNMGHVPLRLHSGTKVCQFIFEKTIGKAKYAGKFTVQTEP